MEIGFIIIMACIVFLGALFIYLAYTHRHRSCRNCKFYHPRPKSHIGGTCQGFGHNHFHWECCDEWKRKPIKHLEEE